jgi:uncharacterized protein (TIGR02302 family)
MSRSVQRALTLTRWGMVWERLIAAFWPLAVLMAAGFAMLSLGVVEAMPSGILPWIAGLWLVLVIAAAVLGGLRMRRVLRMDVVLRLDRTLAGRPLTALADRAAIGGEGALWAAHLAQMQAAAELARAVPPDAELERRDPFALRLVGLVALVMALIFGGIGQMGQGIDAIASTMSTRDVPQTTVQGGPAWEGWAEPPAYTRRPTIYLNALADGQLLELPKGSVVQFRLYGDENAVQQDIGPAQGDDPQAPAFRAEVSGTVRILDRQFDITVLPDNAPEIALGAVASRRADGRMIQDFTASDDHGVISADAVIALDLAKVDRRFGLAVDPEPRDPVELPLPVSRRDSQQIKGQLVQDLSRHPWANLPVSLTLNAIDGIEQVGQSEARATVLPGRRFFNPLAASLIEMRRDLLWSRANARRSAEILRALTWQPDGFVEDGLYDELRGAVGLLEGDAFTADTRDKLAEALWQAAIQLEDGGLSDALQKMRDAQEKLSEAIRNGASPDEVQQLMDQLRDATQDYTRMLAEQSEEQQADSPDQGQEDSQQVTGDQIQQMMEEIQRLMNEGRMAEAEQLLEQFNQLMENLQVRQSQGQQGEGSEGSQPMNRLADTLREQQRLSDEAFRDAHRQFREGGEAGDDDLADRQRDLREELEQQRGLLPGQGSERGDDARRQLDQAGRAMDDAEQALRDGDNGGALQRQADAIQSMREGMQSMGDMLAEEGRQGQDGQQGDNGEEGQQPGQTPGGQDTGGADEGQQGRDPLGRQNASRSELGEDGPNPASRALELLDDIRRRMGDPSRSKDEMDYLDRLRSKF